MKSRYFALILALSFIAWAQAPTSNPNPKADSSKATQTEGCCHHGSDMKGGCCHHAMGDMAKSDKKEMSCCGGDKCQAKNGKSCCAGKDMKSCKEGCKKTGSCQDAKCCSGGKGCCGEATETTAMKCCGGNKCERHGQGAEGN